MHREGILKLGDSKIIDQLRPNGTFYRSLTLAGRASADGTCAGGTYSDYYGSWDQVVVQAHVKISLRVTRAPVHLESGRVILRSGTICQLADGQCIDSDDGYSFWPVIPNHSCQFNQYDVLYEGTASKISGTMDAPYMLNTTIYTLTTRDITFALTQTRPHTICGYTLIATEHPKLFIFETRQGNTFKTKSDTMVENLDLFTYMNSKFVYVERHVKNQMTALYHDIMTQKCELERQVLQNTLSLATIMPDEFAFRLMKSPGYMAVTAGEVVHVLKCIATDVSLRRTNTCYTDLPVTSQNTTLFLTPKSRVLVKYSTKIPCNPLLPSEYHIDNHWIQFTPFPLPAATPQILKPLTTLSWSYTTLNSLATSGIYSDGELQELREHIMFPAEKGAILHSIARGFTGQAVDNDAITISGFLSEKTLHKIYSDTITKIWNGFMIFGSATAGILGIYVIIKITKMIVNTLLQGYALHSAYGCTLHLLGALWGSVAYFLLHLAEKNKSHEQQEIDIYAQPHEAATVNPTEHVPVVVSLRDLQARISHSE